MRMAAYAFRLFANTHLNLILRHRQAIKDAGSVSEETAARVKQAHAKYREKYIQ